MTVRHQILRVSSLRSTKIRHVKTDAVDDSAQDPLVQRFSTFLSPSPGKMIFFLSFVPITNTFLWLIVPVMDFSNDFIFKNTWFHCNF